MHGITLVALTVALYKNILHDFMLLIMSLTSFDGSEKNKIK